MEGNPCAMTKKKKRKKAKVINLQPKMSLQKYIKLKARNLEIHEVFIGDGIFRSGKGHVIFVRKKRNGQKLVGVYLVDTWCLGVKDTFYLLLEDFEYPDFIETFSSQPEYSISSCDINHACNVIYGAIEYAEDLGIEPHKDFNTSEYILVDVDEVAYEELEFGDQGKPHFMAYDTDNRGAIISKLNKSVGEGEYIYTDGEFYMNVDAPSIHASAAEEYLIDFEDKKAYHTYVTMLLMIEQMCMTDVDRYRQIFIKDHNEFLKSAYLDEFQFLKDSANGDASELETLEYYLLVTAESYFINGGTDFILLEENVRAFATDLKDDLFRYLCEINILEYGRTKLNLLVTTASSIMETMEHQNNGVNAVEKFYKNHTRIPENISLEYSLLVVIFSFLEGHEKLYGEIDFDTVTILS